MMYEIKHFVENASWAGTSTRTGEIYNPATGNVTGKVLMASKQDVDYVVEKAAKALPDWAATPPAMRAAIMFNFRSLLLTHIDELAEMLSAEHGKTIPDAKG